MKALYHILLSLLLACLCTGIAAASTSDPSSTAPPIANAESGATMAQAYASYEAGNVAWSRAWSASDIALIRQHLGEAKAAFTTCLNTANQVNDPANAANLALMKSVSTAYIALADAALAMYDGADVYSAGRGQMNAGQYAAAAASFQSAGDTFQRAQTLFGQATATLQGVSYAGTSFGDGSAYTAAIVPILNAKAAYMGEFASYARGWQHTALAYQASGSGDATTFRSEATQAMTLFGSLRTSATFGADATSNYNILAGLLGATPTTVTTAPTQSPVTGAAITELVAEKAITVTCRGASGTFVVLTVKNLRNQPVSFTIPVGTFFDSADGSIHDLVTVETLTVTLGASESRAMTIWTACADFHLTGTGSSDVFRVLATPPDARLLPVLKALAGVGASREIFQAAVWIITDNADYDVLGAIGHGGAQAIDANSAATAMRAIDQNGVDITKKAIWADRNTILDGITDQTLKAWLTGRA